MKIRKGFVSNSSSNSFTCNVCGHTETDYDLSLNEAEMYECGNRHIFCVDEEVATNREEVDEDYDDNYNVSMLRCPICQMISLNPGEVYKYFLKKEGKTDAEILENIRKEFQSYEEFKNFIEDK